MQGVAVGAVLWLLTLVEIAGGSGCPDARAIERRLRAIGSGARAGRVSVVETDDGFHVEARDDQGNLVGERTLAATGTCDDRADSIAVVIAAWQSEFGDHAPPPLPTRHDNAVFAAHPRPPTLRWDVAAAFLGTIAGGAFAAGGTAEATVGRHGFPLAARIGLAASDTRDLALAGGQVRWTRSAVLLGPVVDAVATRWVRLDIHADLALGWMHVDGRGYAKNYGDDSFDPALGAGVRFSIPRWPVQPWIDCTLLGWVRHQTMTVSDPSASASIELPRFDAWLRAGIAYGKR